MFAAYDLASGSVIAQHYRRHRHQEFLRFLRLIDAAGSRHPQVDQRMDKDPKPFVWTKSADDILETLADYCRRFCG